MQHQDDIETYMSLWRNVFRPVITCKADVRRFVISVTLFAWLLDFVVHGVAHLLMFESWQALLRDWIIGTGLVVAIAMPIARTMGRAYLELHHAKKEADRLSRTDPLTGLANRRALYEAAKNQFGATLALVIADIDRFKNINDEYGHIVGDEIIKKIALRMEAELGDLGTVARVGGEEFALVTVGRTAGDVYERLREFRERVAAEPIDIGDQHVKATISIGFASRYGAGFEALYAAADKALYFAKSTGRNRVVDYDQTTNSPVLPSQLAS